MVSVSSERIVGASVGDSGVWLVREQTHEDLSAGQKRKPRLGTAQAIPIPFSCQFAAGTVLLATDGLLRYAPPQHICDAARHHDLPTAVARLIELVRLPSGQLQDDVALIVCR